MDFFTKIDIPAIDWQIDYNSHVAFFGSCFADNISAQFAARKFKVLVNPFGTVYNPLSIAMQIKAIANKQIFGGPEVFQDMRPDRAGNNAPWHCWDAHGSLSAATREECIAKLNEASAHALDFLQKTDVAFITLGTSFVYFLKDIGAAVSNCHQQNPNLFIRKMISVDHVVAALKSIVQDLQKIKRDMRIVFTVSPLRHLSDGAHANTLSKATLQLAINKIIEEQDFTTHTTEAAVQYFPSYEIVMDGLRDYRFYDSDMIHLSKIAENYIFERMSHTYCNEDTRENIRKVEKFMKSASHRIGDIQTQATQEFALKQLAQAEELEKQISGLDLSEERQYFAKKAI